MRRSSHFRAGGTWKLGKDAQTVMEAAAEDLRRIMVKGDVAASILRQAIVLTE